MLDDRMTALVGALVRGETGGRHILTVQANSAMSTAIGVRDDGSLDVEHEAVLRALGELLDTGGQAGVILRTFSDEVSHTLPNGVAIPVKTLRGWFADDGELHPLEEAAVFNAHCIDATTGEPLPPERGVVYADAWPVVLD